MRPLGPLGVFGIVWVALATAGGCGSKDKDPVEVALNQKPPPPPPLLTVPPPEPTPSETVSAPPPPPPPSGKVSTGVGLESCCAELARAASHAVSNSDAERLRLASGVCARALRDPTITRAKAVAQIRAAASPAPVPGSCR